MNSSPDSAVDTEQESFQARAAHWREAFDQSFAAAPSDEVAVLEDFLALRIGETGLYALRLDEVAGLQTLKALTPFPSERRELLGLGTYRGEVLPIFDLRVMLGHEVSGKAPGWWVVVQGASVGLAFDAFERHLRLPPDALARASTEDARLYSAETLRSDGQLRPIVSIAAILKDIRRQVGQSQQQQQPSQEDS